MDQAKVKVRFKYNFSNPSYSEEAEAKELKRDEEFSVNDILLFTEIVVRPQDVYSPIHVAIAAWHEIFLQKEIDKNLGLNISRITVFSDSGNGTDLADPLLDEAGRRAVLNGMSSKDFVGVGYGLKAYATVDL